MKNKRTGKLPFFKRIVQTDPLIYLLIISRLLCLIIRTELERFVFAILVVIDRFEHVCLKNSFYNWTALIDDLNSLRISSEELH